MDGRLDCTRLEVSRVIKIAGSCNFVTTLTRIIHEGASLNWHLCRRHTGTIRKCRFREAPGLWGPPGIFSTRPVIPSVITLGSDLDLTGWL